MSRLVALFPQEILLILILPGLAPSRLKCISTNPANHQDEAASFSNLQALPVQTACSEARQSRMRERRHRPQRLGFVVFFYLIPKTFGVSLDLQSRQRGDQLHHFSRSFAGAYTIHWRSSSNRVTLNVSER